MKKTANQKNVKVHQRENGKIISAVTSGYRECQRRRVLAAGNTQCAASAARVKRECSNNQQSHDRLLTHALCY